MVPAYVVIICGIGCYVFGYFMGWAFCSASRKLSKVPDDQNPEIEPCKTYQDVIDREG